MKRKFKFVFSGLFLLLIFSLKGNDQIETPSKRNLKADAALKYCKGNNFNTQWCILVDMSIHSGKHRFFVWDFKKKSIIDSSLVSHGCCDNTWSSDESKTNPTFKNVSDSHCSSLGKYKIGKRGYSNWGINVNYKLHGLDASNSRAYKRIIVLHSWDLVSEEATFPTGTPEGWGCPAISNSKMESLDERLKASDLPVLLWIYN